MSARSALKAADERKRPRQSNFSSLSAGLIERGRVPAEVLYGPEASPAPRPAADLEPIAAQPEPTRAEPIEPFEDRVLRPQIPDDKAEAERLAAAERTRPLELTFGTLTDDMMERGKLPRHFLTKEQIDLLLSPQKVAPEMLYATAAPAEPQEEGEQALAPPAAEPVTVEIETDRIEAAAAAEEPPASEDRDAGPEVADGDVDATAVAVDASVEQTTVDEPAPPTELVETEAVAEPTSRVPYDPTLPILREAEAISAASPPIGAAPPEPVRARRPVLWAAGLLVAALGGWALWPTSQPPVPTPVASVPTKAPEIVEVTMPAPVAIRDAEPAESAEPPAASQPVAETPAVDVVAETAPTRQRPGAAHDDGAAIALAAPPEPSIAPTVAPPPAEPVPVSTPPESDVESTADLLQRGDEHLLRGDIAAARLFYERAAEAGDAQAMMTLAQTYDPQVLRKLGARGIRPEPELAQRWYARAAEAQARSGR